MCVYVIILSIKLAIEHALSCPVLCRMFGFQIVGSPQALAIGVDEIEEALSSSV